jgi:hypothetical protein
MNRVKVFKNGQPLKGRPGNFVNEALMKEFVALERIERGNLPACLRAGLGS